MNPKIKISQLPAKGSNLAAADLLEVAEFTGTGYISKSITGQEIIDAAVGNVDWGDIGGTLSDQTDLNTALSGKVPTTRTLTINGTTQDLSADRTFTISTGITIGTTAITSGTVGRVLFEGTGNVVQESANLFWDNTNGRLGIGTSSPGTAIDVQSNTNSDIRASVSSNDGTIAGAFIVQHARGTIASRTALLANDRLGGFFFSGYNGTNFVNPAALIGFAGENFSGSVNGGYFGFETTANGGTSRTEKVRINGNGNVLINTTTDAGFKLDVNGTARVATSLEIINTGGITFGGGATALSYVGGGQLHLGNSATWTDVRLYAGAVVKFSQTSSLTTITNTTINLSTATVQLAGVSALAYSGADVRIGSITAGFTSLSFYTAATEKMRIAATTGNVLINTTIDAGFKLDVNGTARVGSATVSTSYQRDLVLAKTQAGYVTAMSVFNGSNTGITGFYLGEDNTSIAFNFKYGSGVAGNWAGTSLPIANTYQIATGSSNNLPLIIQGTPIVLAPGLTATNIGVRHDATCFKIGTLADVHTSGNASASLQVDSTTKGFLPPRMTTTQKNAIATPAAGLMVYDTTLNVISYYNGTSWI